MYMDLFWSHGDHLPQDAHDSHQEAEYALTCCRASAGKPTNSNDQDGFCVFQNSNAHRSNLVGHVHARDIQDAGEETTLRSVRSSLLKEYGGRTLPAEAGPKCSSKGHARQERCQHEERHTAE